MRRAGQDAQRDLAPQQPQERLAGQAMGADGGHPLLSGWRRELAGDSLLALLRGEIALRVLPRAPHVAEQAG